KLGLFNLKRRSRSARTGQRRRHRHTATWLFPVCPERLEAEPHPWVVQTSQATTIGIDQAAIAADVRCISKGSSLAGDQNLLGLGQRALPCAARAAVYGIIRAGHGMSKLVCACLSY